MLARRAKIESGCIQPLYHMMADELPGLDLEAHH